jgi:hypothetical protein
MIDGRSGFFSSAHRLVVTDDGFHGAEYVGRKVNQGC